MSNPPANREKLPVMNLDSSLDATLTIGPPVPWITA